MFGLKQTLVTVSLCPLKCRSSVGSSCRVEFLIEAHHKQLPTAGFHWFIRYYVVDNSDSILRRNLYRMQFIRTKLAMAAAPNGLLAAAAEKGGELEGFKLGAKLICSN